MSKWCVLCGKKFGFLKGETRCIRCARCICKACLGGSKIKIRFVKNAKLEHGLQAVCKHCESDIPQFNRDTQVSLRWIDGLFGLQLSKKSSGPGLAGLPQTPERIRGKYSSQQEKLIVTPEQVRLDHFIRGNMNYSFLPHVLYALTEKEIGSAEIILTRVINKLAGRYDWKRLPAKVDILCTFFLTLASEETTFAVLTYLIDKVFPEYILQSILESSRYTQALSWSQRIDSLISSIERFDSSISEAQKVKAAQFLESFGLDILTSLFINILSLQCFFHAIDSLIISKDVSPSDASLVYSYEPAYLLVRCHGEHAGSSDGREHRITWGSRRVDSREGVRVPRADSRHGSN